MCEVADGSVLDEGTGKPPKSKPIPKSIPPGFDPDLGRLADPHEEKETPPPQTDDGENG